MAHHVEHAFTKMHGPYTGLTVLEVGSANDNSRSFRSICEGSTYLGLDQQEGKYVNILHDLEKPLAIDPVDVVLCFSVLEHCSRPWLMAENIELLLKKGGLLLLSVPFAFKYHAHPKDYYRYTFDALEFLFPNIELVEKHTWPEETNLGDHPHGSVFLLASGRKV